MAKHISKAGDTQKPLHPWVTNEELQQAYENCTTPGQGDVFWRILTAFIYNKLWWTGERPNTGFRDVGSAETAEDYTQEAVMYVLEALPTFVGDGADFIRFANSVKTGHSKAFKRCLIEERDIYGLPLEAPSSDEDDVDDKGNPFMVQTADVTHIVSLPGDFVHHGPNGFQLPKWVFSREDGTLHPDFIVSYLRLCDHSWPEIAEIINDQFPETLKKGRTATEESMRAKYNRMRKRDGDTSAPLADAPAIPTAQSRTPKPNATQIAADTYLMPSEREECGWNLYWPHSLLNWKLQGCPDPVAKYTRPHFHDPAVRLAPIPPPAIDPEHPDTGFPLPPEMRREVVQAIVTHKVRVDNSGIRTRDTEYYDFNLDRISDEVKLLRKAQKRLRLKRAPVAVKQAVAA